MSHPDDTHRARAPRWPLLFIFAAACAFCWPVFTGKIMSPADMCLLMLPWKTLQGQFPGFLRAYNPLLDPIQQYLPWRIYAVESLRAGVIPLWNPYSFCGTPFLANLQSAVLYPPNLLFLITGAGHGFGVSAILHLTMGGWFMYWFLLELRIRHPAALFGALVFMFNGFTVTWLEYPTLSLWVLMWLPGILLCYQRSLARPLSVWPALCGLLVGVQFLGGHLQISAYVMMAFLLYALVRVAAPGQTWGQRGQAALLAAAPLTVGLALAAGQILPTLELARHSGRVTHGLAGALTTAFPPTHLLLYFIPNFFGNPADYNYWGNFQNPAINFLETACYVGILPLFLAAVAVRRWKEAAVWFFGALTVLALLAALGTPVYLVLYYLAPGFRELAGLGRILCLAAFGLAGLAAVGMDELLSPERSGSVGLLVLAVMGAVGLVMPASSFWFLSAIDAMGPIFRDYHALQKVICWGLCLISASLVCLRAQRRLDAVPFTALALGLLLCDLFWFGVRFNPYTDSRMVYPATETTRWLQRHARHQRVTSLASDGMDWMAHNSSMIFGLRDIHGSDSLRVKRSFELVSPPDGNQAHYPPPGSPLLTALSVKYLVTRLQLSGAWRLVRDGDVPIYEQPGAAPRARLTQWVEVVSDEEALRALRSAGAPPWAGVPDPEVAARLRPRAPRWPPSDFASATVEFEADGKNAVALRVKSDNEGVLILNDSYYPGWRARVNGRETPIYRVNYAFRGVSVPAGESRVVMRYQPASFRAGVFLSLLALALLAGWACVCFRSRRDNALATASRP